MDEFVLGDQPLVIIPATAMSFSSGFNNMPIPTKSSCFVTFACFTIRFTRMTTMRLLSLAALLSIECAVIRAQPDPGYLITTITGNGMPGFSGDGGPAIAAQINNPGAVAVDRLGNLFIADINNFRVRKITPSGTITTVAGNGTQGFSGDGGFATSAQLGGPHSVATDIAGNIYVADGNNSRIRKVNPSGIITTVAGSGITGFSGDGGPATAARLVYPYSVTVDTLGNLYIAEYQGNRIRKVSANGVISTVVGNGTRGFSGDGGAATLAMVGSRLIIASDVANNLYIIDKDNFRIRKVTPNGIITTLAGNGSQGVNGDGGLARSAQLDNPNGVSVDPTGNVFISESDRRIVRKITPQGFINTVAGNGGQGFGGDGGPATLAQFDAPTGSATDAMGNIYISDRYRVRKLIATRSTSGCRYSIAPQAEPLGSGSGLLRLSIVAARDDCPWLATTSTSWITLVSGASGSGNGTVVFAIEANNSAQVRTTTVAVAGQSFIVRQPGLACSYSFRQDDGPIPPSGGNGVILVSSIPLDCTWNVSSSSNWIFVTSSTSNTGSGTVTYSVSSNSGRLRTGTIDITGPNLSKGFTITQAPLGAVIPVISQNGVVSAASFAGGAIAPGEFISIFGSGIGPPTPVVSRSLERGLADTRVFINGTEAFLTYTSFGQINALVPYGIQTWGTVNIQTEFQGLRSGNISLPAANSAPGVFTANGSGSGAAIVINEDGVLNSSTTPALRGSIVALFATGQGLVEPAGVDGELVVGPPYAKSKLPVSISIGGVIATQEDIVFAGLVYPGVFQVNVRVPRESSPGIAEVLLRIGGVSSRTGVTLGIL